MLSIRPGPLRRWTSMAATDDHVAQFIRFVGQWMHELILQKQTKETKEEPKPSSSPSGQSTCKCYFLHPLSCWEPAFLSCTRPPRTGANLIDAGSSPNVETESVWQQF